jgi:hypothetical protein
MKKTLAVIGAVTLGFIGVFALLSLTGQSKAQVTVTGSTAYYLHAGTEIVNSNQYTNYTGWVATDGPTFLTNRLLGAGQTYSNLAFSAINAGQYDDLYVQMQGYGVALTAGPTNTYAVFIRSIDGVTWNIQDAGAYNRWTVALQQQTNSGVSQISMVLTNMPATNYWKCWMITNTTGGNLTNFSIKYFGRSKQTLSR